MNEFNIEVRLSTLLGSHGDQLPSTPHNSLGRYVSTTEIDCDIGNLFPSVRPLNNTSGIIDEYRCIFVYNNNEAGEWWTDVRVWVDPACASFLSVSVDSTPMSIHDSAPVQAKQTVLGIIPPAGQTFYTVTDYLSGIPLGNIRPKFVKAIWVRRHLESVTHTFSLDAAIIHIEGRSA